MDLYNPLVRDLVSKTKELLIEIIPGVQEIVDEKARIIAYGFGPKYCDNICAIILSKKGVKLGFHSGAVLPDKYKLLEGKGKVHKYVKINDDVLESRALNELIKAGFSTYKKRTAERNNLKRKI